MCEYERDLVAWIDGELEPDATLELENHLQTCAFCAEKARQFRKVTAAFAACYQARPIRKKTARFRWAAVSAAGFATSAMVLWTLRPEMERLPVQIPKTPQPPAIAFETQPPSLPVPAGNVRHHAVTKRAAAPQTAWPGEEPFVQIAIPGDDIFAPGALPAGFTFAAELSVGDDGSPRVLRVHPGVYLK